MFNKIKKSGFTLVEVLIVIIIVGILIAALLPRLTGAQARARDTSRQAGVNQIAQAAALYAADTPGAVFSGCGDDLALDDYLVSVPTDPAGDNVNNSTCTNGNYAIYSVSGSNNDVVVVAEVEDTDSGNCTLS
jgi:prepilin-type N-terminal cleavage/methylation domain-containing protein